MRIKNEDKERTVTKFNGNIICWKSPFDGYRIQEMKYQWFIQSGNI